MPQGTGLIHHLQLQTVIRVTDANGNLRNPLVVQSAPFGENAPDAVK